MERILLKRLLDKQEKKASDKGTIVPFWGDIWLNWNDSWKWAADGRHTKLVFCHSLHSLDREGSRVFPRGNPWKPYDGKLFTFVFCVVLIALLCYSAVRYHTLTSQVCNWSALGAELAYLCLEQPLVGVWSHMGWLSFARWGVRLPVWKQGVGDKVRVGGRVREGGVHWLHSCTGSCYQ